MVRYERSAATKLGATFLRICSQYQERRRRKRSRLIHRAHWYLAYQPRNNRDTTYHTSSMHPLAQYTYYIPDKVLNNNKVKTRNPKKRSKETRYSPSKVEARPPALARHDMGYTSVCSSHKHARESEHSREGDVVAAQAGSGVRCRCWARVGRNRAAGGNRARRNAARGPRRTRRWHRDRAAGAREGIAGDGEGVGHAAAACDRGAGGDARGYGGRDGEV
ncbi:hypothetical protein C2E23DRAFT_847444 [Lenzites betulinus]|nr:hypothetical protein C2E23DRAFT_847444 [Lenzites betulinus]